MNAIYESVISYCKHNGVEHAIEQAIDWGDQLVVMGQVHGSGIERLFAIADRTYGLYVWCRDGSLYQLQDKERIVPLCARLLHNYAQPRVQSLGGTPIPSEFDLKIKTIQEWTRLGESHRRRRLEMQGWEELPDAEADAKWKQFCADLNIRWGSGQDNCFSVAPPHPFITITAKHNMSVAGTDHVTVALCEQSMKLSLLNSLKWCTSSDEFIFAMDVNHSFYRFRPHDPRVSLSSEWPIAALPWTDIIVYSTMNNGNGVIGDPVQRTLCVFGKEMTETFDITFLDKIGE